MLKLMGKKIFTFLRFKSFVYLNLWLFFYFSKDARIRALAAAWARHDHPLAEAFLEDRDSYGVNEVLKALSLLDAGRQVRVLEKKMKRLQFSTGKVKPQTMGRLKSDIDNLNAIKPLVGVTKIYVIFIYLLPRGPCSEGSDESAHPCSLSKAFAAHTRS